MANFNFYTGMLGSDASRFPGQDSTDIHLTNFDPPPNGPVVKMRQHHQCFGVGMSFAYPEVLNTAAQAPQWVYSAAILLLMDFLDHGVSTPLVPVRLRIPALLCPPPLTSSQVIEPGVPINVTMAVVNGGGGVAVGGYRLPWFHHIVERNTAPQGALHYYKHSKRTGHTPADTPVMYRPGHPKHKHHTCRRITFGAHSQQYRKGS